MTVVAELGGVLGLVPEARPPAEVVAGEMGSCEGHIHARSASGPSFLADISFLRDWLTLWPLRASLPFSAALRNKIDFYTFLPVSVFEANTYSIPSPLRVFTTN